MSPPVATLDTSVRQLHDVITIPLPGDDDYEHTSRRSMACVVDFDAQTMRPARGYYEFGTARPLPAGDHVTVEPRDPERDRNFFLREKRPLPAFDEERAAGHSRIWNVSSNEWDLETRAHHFTVGDLKRLTPGDTFPLLIMDRNLLDMVECPSQTPGNVATAPTAIFVGNRHVYKHAAGACGRIEWSFGGGRAFTWEIEYAPGRWYPLDADGTLPAVDRQQITPLLGERKMWSDFSDSTRLGWRGASMRWSHVEDLTTDGVLCFWHDM